MSFIWNFCVPLSKNPEYAPYLNPLPFSYIYIYNYNTYAIIYYNVCKITYQLSYICIYIYIWCIFFSPWWIWSHSMKRNVGYLQAGYPVLNILSRIPAPGYPIPNPRFWGVRTLLPPPPPNPPLAEEGRDWKGGGMDWRGERGALGEGVWGGEGSKAGEGVGLKGGVGGGG